jgi:hypothetical protein
MPAQLELEANASVFCVIAEVKMNERPAAHEEINEMQLAILSHEITAYNPDLAMMLALAGRRKLLAA